MSKEPLTKSLYTSILNTSTEVSAGSGAFREGLPASLLAWHSFRSSCDLWGICNICMQREKKAGREGGREEDRDEGRKGLHQNTLYTCIYI